MQPLRLLNALSGVALLSALGSLAVPAAAQAATYRDVANVAAGHVAWIHLHPTAASPRVGYLEAGALRVRTSQCKQLAKAGWCRVTRRGTRGWVQDRFPRPDRLMRS